MAQHDTGLGWSAKSEWLLDGVGDAICSYSSYAYPDGQFPDLPVNVSDIEFPGDEYVKSHGTLIAESNRDRYYALATENNMFVRYSKSGSYLNFQGMSPSNTNRLLIVAENKNTGVVSSVYDDVTDSTLVIKDGVQWYSASSIPTGVYGVGGFVYYLPTATAANVVDALVGVSETFYKQNGNYAVACVAKWRVRATGELRESPILISTLMESTAITSDAVYSKQTSTHLYDGRTFYMSLITNLTEAITNFNVPFIDLSDSAGITTDQLFTLIRLSPNANIIVIESPDPYDEPPSEEGGGDGEPVEDDPVEEETLPLPALVGLGFATIYVPTQSDLASLAAYLWGGHLDLDNFLKLFANPMDSILGLSAVPLVLSGTYEPIYLGGQLLQGITMPRYTGRTAVKVDMGTVTINERWGAYLDYDPYTELSIYVPFIGIKNIKADDVMGKTVRLMYNIDILSGACVAYLRIEGGSVIYEWAGQCAEQIPITGANWDNIFRTAISTAVTLGGALFAPASAPVLGGAVASAAVQAVAAKPRIERSGAISGITGFLGQLRPYIIRTIPEAYIPGDQNKFIGYPSYVSVNLGQLTGYNEIASIHLENIPATGDELSELESILKGGVIF